uniref:Protein YIF1 n=1 Tax=Plectus sambesii TaxID=2011161 RepID=A0A914WQ37_9BILA
DWSVKYGNSDEPVPARFDINAPDLYIPLMALVTYVLVAGFVLGTQGRFTPEQLGLLASNAVAWLVLENFFILVTKYVMNISQALSLWHTLAFSSYKFVGMIISLLVFLAFGRTAYYWTLGYFAVAVAFFLIRTVKTFVLEGPGAYAQDGGTKRKLYLLLFISLTQPFIMWWLTSSITNFVPGKMDLAEMAMAGIGMGAAKVGGAVGGAKAFVQPDGEVDYEALLRAP